MITEQAQAILDNPDAFIHATTEELARLLADENARLREAAKSAAALLRTIDKESGYGSGMIAIVLLQLEKALA